MERKWRYFPDECHYCGDDLEVFTVQEEEGVVEDEDAVRCIACGATGVMQVFDYDDVRIGWHGQE